MANLQFKCPCCGGTLEFDNKTQNIVCPYCDSQFTADDLKQYSDELASDKQEETAWDESRVQEYTNEEMKGMKIYSCDSCGGEIIVDETTSSTKCPYCGNNLVVSKQLSGDLRPNFIIPFKNDKENVVADLRKYFRKKPLLPGSFSKENSIEEIKSLYVPFWLFDADVDGKVRFKGEVTRTWSDSNYNYKETKYYSIIRGGCIAFDHVPVDGSSKMEDKLMESIEPFNFNEAKDFNVAYLAGIAADRYDIDKDVTFNRATQRFRDGTIQAFRDDVHGFSNVTVEDSNIQLSNTVTNYVLYPVWLLSTKWRDKQYMFAVNGQTGKVAGNLPISVPKFLLFWFLFFLVIGGATFGLGFAISSEILVGVLAGVFMGALMATIILLIMRRANRAVRFQYGAANYVREDSLHIDTRREIFLYRRVTKTRRASSKD